MLTLLKEIHAYIVEGIVQRLWFLFSYWKAHGLIWIKPYYVVTLALASWSKLGQDKGNELEVRSRHLRTQHNCVKVQGKEALTFASHFFHFGCWKFWGALNFWIKVLGVKCCPNWAFFKPLIYFFEKYCNEVEFRF